jgi:hypothetical protein
VAERLAQRCGERDGGIKLNYHHSSSFLGGKGKGIQ